MIELSIVILSFNTKDILKNCLRSVFSVKDKTKFEVIVVDNGSIDESAQMVKKKFPKVKLIENKNNLGFSGGNNSAKPYCNGKFILFLNSDTEVKSFVIDECINYLKEYKRVGALTCKVILESGKLDKDTRRSFPTPWVAFTHFSKLDRLFPNSKLFSKYWYEYLPEDSIEEIDSLQGAFFLVRKKILEEVGWFDEDYFLDGEDIDLCWRIREKGWKIIYYPKVSIIHLKGASKGKNLRVKKISFLKRLKFVMAGVNSMEIFYKKRLWKKYSIVTNLVVFVGINILKLVRLFQVLIYSL